MLRITDLEGGYGQRPVLGGISLKMAQGETVAILGSNTAGKTTLIRAIMGQLPKVSGAIVFEGRDIIRIASHQRAGFGMALVPEGRHVFPAMTVEDNVLVGAYHRRRDLTEGDLQASFEMFPRLKERRRQLAGTLSGGEQQMVAICRALMAKPRLLLLDEPSHGLAPLMVEEVHRAIAHVNRRGVAVLLVEQNVTGALKLVQRGYVLAGGCIEISGTTQELAANDAVRRAYLGI